MAKALTPQQIKSIVAAAKPGFEAETEETSDQEYAALPDQTHVQTGAPDLEYLANKFLAPSQSNAKVAAAHRDSATASHTSQIVRVHPAGVPPIDAAGTGSRKVVVVSAKEEKVVGEQG
jgi:hypothetical protein